ncbi:hypothetical protein AAMO2058_000737000 [Amorphochlora amoebiformis]
MCTALLHLLAFVQLAAASSPTQSPRQTEETVWGCPNGGWVTSDSYICKAASVAGIPVGTPIAVIIGGSQQAFNSCSSNGISTGALGPFDRSYRIEIFEELTKSPTRCPTITQSPTANPTSLSPTSNPTTVTPTTNPLTVAPTTSTPTQNPGTVSPSSTSPTRDPTTSPQSLAPITLNPSSFSPSTSSPFSLSPLSIAPLTFSPSTEGPSACPLTANPASAAPSTTPVTESPTLCPSTDFPSVSPSTLSPTSNSPKTIAPATISPASAHPFTQIPTHIPTSVHPATLGPISQTPSSNNPVSAVPTSFNPSSVLPTTGSPITGQPTEATLTPSTGSPLTAQPTSSSPVTDQPSTFDPVTSNPSASPKTTSPTNSPSSQSPTTNEPTSFSPASKTPTTGSPQTLSPTSLSPKTTIPTSANPATFAPSSLSPSSQSPISCSPSTLSPVTVSPTSLSPQTSDPSVSPTSLSPSSSSPSSQNPLTSVPTSSNPTSLSPITETPTTGGPTSCSPTTLGPVTTLPSMSPSSCSPSTNSPSSCSPTSLSPSSNSPSSISPSSLAPSSLNPSSLSPSSTSPSTCGPTSTSPSSCSPSSRHPSTSPTSLSPSSVSPSSCSPSSCAPTSLSPSSLSPSSCSPSSCSPTSLGPTSLSPSSCSPTSCGPTSLSPSSLSPSSCSPTSCGPTSLSPSSCSPSTLGPSSVAPTMAPTRSPYTWMPTVTRYPTFFPTPPTTWYPSPFPTPFPTPYPTPSPTSLAPSSQSPSSCSPSSCSPSSCSPSSCSPSSCSPSSLSPSSYSPSSCSPSSCGPTSLTPSCSPTSCGPTSLSPSSLSPSTCSPSSCSPSSLSPSSHSPSSLNPTSTSPSTLGPTSLSPSSLSPQSTMPTSLAPSSLSPSSLSPTSCSPSSFSPKTSTPSTSPTSLSPSSSNPLTANPTTLNPVSQHPSTLSPQSNAPTSKSPETAAPSTFHPVSSVPTTGVPVTRNPTSLSPVSSNPTSFSPATSGPSTTPTSCSPSSLSPTSVNPSTFSPESAAPTTLNPSTLHPSSLHPFTNHPGTSNPTSLSPKTTQPSISPTSLSPTSLSPQTSAPSLTPTSGIPSSNPSSCSPSSTSPSTLTPGTTTPTSLSPETSLPVESTGVPLTFSPTTITPTSLCPSSTNPVTVSPQTVTPTSLNPSSSSPESVAPSSLSPSSHGPSSASPVSKSPTSFGPSTVHPSSVHPFTTQPGTISPTDLPTTNQPSSAPTTKGPSSNSPTSAAPLSFAPTTISPLSSQPTLSPHTSLPTQGPTFTTVSPTTLAPVTGSPSVTPSQSPTTFCPSTEIPSSVSPSTLTQSPGIQAQCSDTVDTLNDRGVLDYNAVGTEYIVICGCAFTGVPTSSPSRAPLGSGVTYAPTPLPSISPSSCSPTSKSPSASPRTQAPTFSPTATCTLPSITEARLKDSAAGISVVFDGDTNQGGMTPANTSCFLIFTSSTVTALGGITASCEWPTAQEITISLPSTATISPGDTLQFRDGTISRSDPSCTDTLMGATIVLQSPLNPPTVLAVASAPATVSSCKNTYIDASASAGTAGRALTYLWGLVAVTGHTNSDLISSVNTLRSQIEAVQAVALDLNTSAITGASVTFTISLNVTNWLSSSGLTTVTFTRIDSLVPVITIVGGTQQTLTSRAQELEVTTEVTPPPSACSTNAAITYIWTTRSPTPLPTLTTETSKSYLYIANNGFPSAGTYEFSLTAQYSGSTVSVSENVTITVQGAKPEVVVRKCDREISIGSGLAEVDAAKSYDPDASSALTFLWTCKRSAADAFGDTTCHSLSSVLAATTTGIFSFNSSLLEPTADNTLVNGENFYELTIQVTNSATGQLSSKNCKLWAANLNSSVEVWVEPSAINTGTNTISLSANSSTDSSNYNYNWTCARSDGTPCDVSLDDPNVALTPSTSPTLVIDTSKLNPSTSYLVSVALSPQPTPASRVKLQNSGPILIVAAALVPVSLPSPPTSGVCTSDPSSGNAYSTTFVLRCLGWVTDDGSSLLYSFIDSSNTVLRASKSSNSFSTTLAGSVTPTTEIRIFTARITTSKGGVTTQTFAISVTTPALDSGAADSLAAQKSTEATLAAQNGDLSATSAAIASSLVLLQTGTGSASTRTVVVDSAITAIQNSPTTTNSAVQKVSLLRTVTTAEAQPTLEAANKTVQTLSTLITFISSSPNVDYTTQFGEETVFAISNVVNTSATSGVGLSSAVNNAVKNLGQIVGSLVQPGQAPLTVTSPGLEVSAAKFDVQAAAAAALSSGIAPPPISIGHGSAGTRQDSADVPLSALLGKSATPLAIFSSSGNFWPPFENRTQLSDLVSLSFTDGQGTFIVVEEVTEGIQINIGAISGAANDAANNELLQNVCQFFNETLGDWSTDGCTGYLASSGNFVCNCTHLTSFQAAQEAVPKVNTISAADIQNLTLSNLMDNPFTLMALTFVFLIYIGISIGARIHRGECKRGAEEEKRRLEEKDFLLQWYLQIVKAPPKTPAERVAEAKARKQRAKKTTSAIGAAFGKKTRRSKNRSRVGSRHGSHGIERKDSRSRSRGSPKGHRRAWSYAGRTKGRPVVGRASKSRGATPGRGSPERGGFGPRATSEFGAVRPIKFVNAEEHVATVNQPPSATTDNESKSFCATWCSCLPCCRPKDDGKETKAQKAAREQEDRRIRLMHSIKLALLSHEGEQNALKRQTSQAKSRKKNKSEFQRSMKVFWHLMTVRHTWISIFYFHRRDPFSLQWRANVLLQTLLLVMMINGFFYGVNQTAGGEISIGIISALVVTVFTLALVSLAKKIGALSWELQACRTRDRLCAPKGAPAGTAAAATLGDSHDTTEVANRVLRLEIMAWAMFILVTAGSAFVVLVFGMQFDLKDKAANGGKSHGLEVQKSTSFKWITSVIISEAFNALLVIPITLLVKTILLTFYITSVMFLLDFLLSDDDLTSVPAYDIFARVVAGRRLSPEAAGRLAHLQMRAQLEHKMSDSDLTHAAEEAPKIDGKDGDSAVNDIYLTIAAPENYDSKAEKSKESKPKKGSKPTYESSKGGSKISKGERIISQVIDRITTDDIKVDRKRSTPRKPGSSHKHLSNQSFGMATVSATDIELAGLPNAQVLDVALEEAIGNLVNSNEDIGNRLGVVSPTGIRSPKGARSPERMASPLGSRRVRRRGTIVDGQEATSGDEKILPVVKRRGIVYEEGDNKTAGQFLHGQITSLGAEAQPEGFSDLPLFCGALKIRVISGTGGKFKTNWVSLALVDVPEERALLILGPDRKTVETAIVSTSFIDSGVTCLNNVKCVEIQPNNKKRFQLVATDAETTETSVYEFEAKGSRSKDLRNHWVKVLRQYVQRAQKTGKAF